MELLKKIYRRFRSFYQRMKFYYSVNWTKTLYFNFKKFPFSIAKKLPVFFYDSVKFQNIEGEIIIEAPIKRGMIGFGQQYELITRSKQTAEIFIKGKVVFKGHMQFGKDYFIYVGENAHCEFGHMASIGRDGKIICKNKIVLGNYARLGFESQIMDTNFHQMIDKSAGKELPMSSPISIGNFNFIGNRVSIMQKTTTPNFCTIASNSVCNKNYVSLGENILIGGIPSKLLKENISRDWEGEKEKLEKYLIV